MSQVPLPFPPRERERRSRPTFNRDIPQPTSGLPQRPQTTEQLLGQPLEQSFQPPVFRTVAEAGKFALNPSAGRRHQQLLGPQLSRIVPQNPQGVPFALTRENIPALQARLNFEQQLLAERDRDFAGEVLEQALAGVGQTPEERFARELALFRAENPDVLSPQEEALRESRVRQEAALGVEDAIRQAREGLARRGLTGSVPAVQEAELRQGGVRQASELLQQLRDQQVLLREQRERESLAALNALLAEEARRRDALAQQIAALFAETERGPIDLSAFA